MRRRRIIFLSIMGLLALSAMVRHPSADIQILTHRAGDADPHKVQAAVDLGVVAVKFLLTWTGRSDLD